jgi:hypothetical protein
VRFLYGRTGAAPLSAKYNGRIASAIRPLAFNHSPLLVDLEPGRTIEVFDRAFALRRMEYDIILP